MNDERGATPAVGKVDFGGLRRVTPVSRLFGFERGLCIDRYYIENFLEARREDVRGRVLEVGDPAYTHRFGRDRVERSEVLHVTPGEEGATLYGRLDDPDFPLEDGALDCLILTQVFCVVPNLQQAVRTVHRILKPGGTLLASLPGLAQISRYDMDRWGDYWRFTDLAARHLFGEVFGLERTEIVTHGNVLAVVAYLHGLAAGELTPQELDHHDPDYPVVVTVRATKERS